MHGPHQLPIPPGFTSGTVAGRRLRHLVPPAGRYSICGAPVAADTLLPSLDAEHRVCPHCVDRVEGRKSPVPQPNVRSAPHAPSSAAAVAVAKPRVTVELSAAAADLLAEMLDPVSRRMNGRGVLVTFAIPLEHADAVAEVLAEAGCRRDCRAIRDAVLAARP